MTGKERRASGPPLKGTSSKPVHPRNPPGRAAGTKDAGYSPAYQPGVSQSRQPSKIRALTCGQQKRAFHRTARSCVAT
jgi:hypothetical protein